MIFNWRVVLVVFPVLPLTRTVLATHFAWHQQCVTSFYCEAVEQFEAIICFAQLFHVDVKDTYQQASWGWRELCACLPPTGSVL